MSVKIRADQRENGGGSPSRAGLPHLPRRLLALTRLALALARLAIVSQGILEVIPNSGENLRADPHAVSVYFHAGLG